MTIHKRARLTPIQRQEIFDKYFNKGIKICNLLSYVFEQTKINSIRFAQTILEHLGKFGIHSSEITTQTDNGSEFIGYIFKKEPSAFTKLIEKTYRAKHQTIPRGKKEYNGSVENFYNRIEDEFYDIESFNSLSESSLVKLGVLLFTGI